MKKLKKLILLSAFILVNMFALSAATEVATIADAKKLAANTNVIFTGDLTLQYVSNAGSDYYAFDDNGDFIRLRCYNWSVLTEIFSLSKGDKIKIPGEVTYVNDENNCVTFDIDATSVRSIISVGSDWVNVSDLDGGVMLVKTIYANNAQFVTKLINK